LDLGKHPFANNLAVNPDEAIDVYPLSLIVCSKCSCAQLSYCADDTILYSQYTYLTPESVALSDHYAKVYQFLLDRKFISGDLHVLEIGSNIGRFLEYLRPFSRSILGVDPAENISVLANQNGIPTISAFFNPDEARKICQTDCEKNLVIARHCFAHNEEPWLMLQGVKELLSENGVFVIENAYFFDTVRKYEFDQVYHEHMYYHTARSISEIARRGGMKLVDAFHSKIHGGSMVYFLMHDSTSRQPSNDVFRFIEQEKDMHMARFFLDFQDKIFRNKSALTKLLDEYVEQGKLIHAYGASAKSTTLFNFYGITDQSIPLVVDSTPTKIGKYIPQANIKVISEAEGFQNPPDYYLLTIWNYKDEIISKVRATGNHQSKFILPHPEVTIIE